MEAASAIGAGVAAIHDASQEASLEHSGIWQRLREFGLDIDLKKLPYQAGYD